MLSEESPLCYRKYPLSQKENHIGQEFYQHPNSPKIGNYTDCSLNNLETVKYSFVLPFWNLGSLTLLLSLWRQLIWHYLKILVIRQRSGLDSQKSYQDCESQSSSRIVLLKFLMNFINYSFLKDNMSELTCIPTIVASAVIHGTEQG